MSVEYCLDTNILLYGYDLDAPEKRLIAASILENAWKFPGSVAVSVQVLQEFFVATLTDRPSCPQSHKSCEA